MQTESVEDFNRRFYIHRSQLAETPISSTNIEERFPEEFKKVRELLKTGKYFALWDIKITPLPRREGYQKIDSFSPALKNLVIINCQFDLPLTILNTHTIESICFIHCSFQALYLPNPYCNLHFIKCQFAEDFRLNGDSGISGKSISFEDSFFHSSAELENLHKLSSLKFFATQRGKVQGNLTIKKIKSEFLCFENFDVAGDTELIGSESTQAKYQIDKLSINKCNWNKINFKNFDFKETLSIKNLEYSTFDISSCKLSYLELSDKFEGKSFKLWDSVAKEFICRNLETKENTSISIENASVITDCIFINTKYLSSLNFLHGSRIDNLSFNGENDQKGKIKSVHIYSHTTTVQIQGLSIEEKLLLGRVKGLQSLNLVDNIIEKSEFIGIDESTPIFNFVSNQFNKGSNLSQIKFNSLKLEDNYFEDDLTIKSCQFEEALNIRSSFFMQRLVFEGATLNDLIISGGVLLELAVDKTSEITSKRTIFFDVNLNQFRPLDKAGISHYFSDSQISHVILENNSLSKETTISFNDSRINYLRTKHYNTYGNLYFRNCSADTSYSYYNFPPTKWGLKAKEWLDSDVHPSWPKMKDPRIELLYSSLGQTEFIEFKFDDYQFNFNNTKLIDCFIAGSQFPENIEIKDVEANTKEYFNQKVLVYNQLKKIAERNGDIVKSSLMHSRALESQHEVLKKTPNKRTERFIFFANKWSSKHGESWTRAFWFTIVGTLFFFTLYIVVEGNYSITGDFDPEIISEYVKFIDPFRKLEFTKHWTSNLLFLLNKIWFGFGVFQLITAFRRHGKK